MLTKLRVFLEFKELVSTGDGDYRMVYAINGKIPGPEIIVTEGDMVGSQEGVISYHKYFYGTMHEIPYLT